MSAVAETCDRRPPLPPPVCLTVPGEGPLAIGDSVRAVAGFLDADHSCLRANPLELTWRASDTTVLDVRANGWVVARASGIATLVVRGERRRREETIEVIPAVDSLVVEGPESALDIGDTTRILATVYFRGGHVRRDVDVAWSLRDATVLSDHFREPEMIRARVSFPAGYLVRAARGGEAWVVATMRHHADSVRVVVRP
jgi:hypothetical protein